MFFIITILTFYPHLYFFTLCIFVIKMHFHLVCVQTGYFDETNVHLLNLEILLWLLGKACHLVEIIFAFGHFSTSLQGEEGQYTRDRQHGALDGKRHSGKIASVPFIFIMVIEFGSKGADIKALLRDS